MRCINQNLAWYRDPLTGYEHLVQLNIFFEVEPTSIQENLLVYPEEDPQRAGYIWRPGLTFMFNLN